MADHKIKNDIYYSKLNKYRNRRFTLWILSIATVLIYTALIFGEITLGHHWTTMALPILLWAILLVTYPATEEWEYTAWQSQPQKQEQTFFS